MPPIWYTASRCLCQRRLAHLDYRDGPSVRVRFIKRLINRGADVDALNENSRTPIIIASKPSREDVISVLLASGANLNIIDELCFSAWHYAAREGCSGSIRRLLEAGADADLLDGCKRGALYLVALYYNTKLRGSA